MDLRGAYTADRAAALSGVPRSTLHYWSSHEVLIPSISAERVKLWSYADLMGLRTIYWLRQPKQAGDGAAVRRSTMPAVRRALSELRSLDLDLWTREHGPAVAVKRDGRILIDPPIGAVAELDGQGILDADAFDVVRPFRTLEGTSGPDLHRPRPRLRIVPGKLAGAPHIEATRLETQAIAALARRGMQRAKIYRLYPIADSQSIDQALELEQQLDANLGLELVAA